MPLMAFLLQCTLHTSIVLFQCHVVFIYSSVGSRGEAPAGGLGDGVPQKLEHFFKVHSMKFKAR